MKCANIWLLIFRLCGIRKWWTGQNRTVDIYIMYTTYTTALPYPGRLVILLNATLV